MKTTLNKIRSNSPCTSGWAKLLKYLGKSQADDVELDLLTILESNGLDDALWCLQTVDGFDKEKRLLVVAFAREAQHLMTDPRSIAALDIAERFANGEATQQELNAARAAARAAADAAFDASVAARAAYYATADAAYAASAATYAATDAAARAAARAAAADAYADADAAYATADAAYAATDATYAATDATYATYAAYDDAYDAMRNKQVQILKKFLEKS